MAGQEAIYRHAHPTAALLAVEVAVTGSELDRAKTIIYAEANIPEYWLVLAKQNRIKVYTLPVEGHYTEARDYHEVGAFVSTVFPALRVDVAALFAE